MKEEVIAIIEDVHCGCRDRDWPMLWFTTHIPESTLALQCLSWEDAGELIQKAGVSDIKNLEGKPCWVEKGEGLQLFVRLVKM